MGCRQESSEKLTHWRGSDKPRAERSGDIASRAAKQIELIEGVLFDLEGEGHETRAIDQNHLEWLAAGPQTFSAERVAVLFVEHFWQRIFLI